MDSSLVHRAGLKGHKSQMRANYLKEVDLSSVTDSYPNIPLDSTTCHPDISQDPGLTDTCRSRFHIAQQTERHLQSEVSGYLPFFWSEVFPELGRSLLETKKLICESCIKYPYSKSISKEFI